MNRAFVNRAFTSRRSTSSIGGLNSFNSPSSSQRENPETSGSMLSDCYADKDGSATQVASSERRRLVMIVDDLQNADKHSCELLKELAYRRPDYILLLTACTGANGIFAHEGISCNHPKITDGHNASHALACQSCTTALMLQPLNLASCERLACSILRSKSLPTEFVRMLHTRSGGSPLLIEVSHSDLMHPCMLAFDPFTCKSSL